MGMGTEALSILNELKNIPPYKDTEQMHTLLGIADFLTRRYASAVEHFLSAVSPKTMKPSSGGR